jgi:hypothetical protein
MQPISRQLRLPEQISKEELNKFLNKDYLSQTQIADLYGVEKQSIRRLMRFYELEIDSSIKYVSSFRTRSLRDRNLNQRQKSIVIGTILGDGHLRIPNGAVNAQLQLGHSIKQRSYLEWKSNELKPFSNDNIRIYEESCFTETTCHPDFTYYNSLFYQDGVKIVPDNITSMINDLAIAVLFGDDGHRDPSNSNISTCNFTVDDCIRLINAIQIKLDVTCKLTQLTSCGKHFPTLFFPNVEHKKLHKIIDPLIPIALEYKKLYKK